MAYADYEFYTTSYFGSVVPEADFPRLAEKASDPPLMCNTRKTSTAKACKEAKTHLWRNSHESQPRKNITNNEVIAVRVSEKTKATRIT